MVLTFDQMSIHLSNLLTEPNYYYIFFSSKINFDIYDAFQKMEKIFTYTYLREAIPTKPNQTKKTVVYQFVSFFKC